MTASGDNPGPRRPVDIEDVDDIIGIASELKEADADTLTVAELEEVGRELDIPPEYVRDAVEELERRRRRSAAATAKAASASRRRRAIAGLVIVFAAGAFFVMANAGRSTLEDAISNVALQTAALATAEDRQDQVEAQWDRRPSGLERDAELTGAANRVAIARRRYDEAAAQYNQAATTLPCRLAIWVFDLPKRIPLSNERADE